MAAALAGTTKLCLVSPWGSIRETKHSLVVPASAAAMYTNLKTALFNRLIKIHHNKRLIAEDQDGLPRSISA